MQQGDIVIMPFPFTDLTDVKLRPALIVSNPTFNKKKNIIVIAISTQQGEKDFNLPLNQKDLKVGFLKKKSYIRFQNIFTIEKRLIIKVVAQIKKTKMEKIIPQIKSFLEL